MEYSDFMGYSVELRGRATRLSWDTPIGYSAWLNGSEHWNNGQQRSLKRKGGGSRTELPAIRGAPVHFFDYSGLRRTKTYHDCIGI